MYTLESVSFFDEDHGITVGENGKFLTTADGGVSWQLDSLDVYTRLYSVVCYDAQSAWLAGNLSLIRKTADRGQNWVRQDSGFEEWVMDLVFLNENIGWGAGAKGHLIHTTDGGGQWEQVDLVNAYFSPVWQQLQTVFFLNPDRGWVAGRDDIMLSTTDGGVSWIEEQGLKLRIPNIFTVQFVDENNGFALGKNDEWNSIFGYTTNGGTNWQRIFFDVRLSDIVFLNPDTGWAVGIGTAGNSLIMKTTNGGFSWESRPTPSQGMLLALEFVTPMTAWAVGWYGNILKTTDGGETWEQQSSPLFTEAHLTNLTFVDVNHGYVSGWNGTVLRTSDGGTSWDLLYSGTSEWLYGIHFTDQNTGWVCGSQGAIMHTTDGGGEAIRTHVNTGIGTVDPALPAVLTLHQNYPNPFNSATTVAFSLEEASHVTVRIYDLTGREVATLTDRRFEPGRHETVWHAGSLPSGLYFCRIRAGRYAQVRKLVLQR